MNARSLSSRTAGRGILLAALLFSTPLLAAGVGRTETPSWCGDRCDEVVIDWNMTAFQALRAHDGYADPLTATRILSMMHLAMHDAANAARPRFTRYTRVDVDRTADPAIAAVTAAHDVLAALVPTQRSVLKESLEKSLFDAGSAPGVASGIALGKRAAAAVLQKRANDGSTVKLSYQEGTRPGEYRFTPGFGFAFHPHWRALQPFALTSPGQFRSVPPPALTSVAYANDLNEVKAVGGKVSSKRTQEETNYAAFWYEFSDIGWNRVARAVARGHEQDLWQRARLFALVNVVMADAYIAGWDSKFHHNLWRPVTAIRLADVDGNAATMPDTAFEPLLVTPPVQDYPSTHSALGAAAAAVLADVLGSDDVRFTIASTSSLPANPTRTFASFGEAARENADSRVKAGLHFRFATKAGLKLGDDIGRHAVKTMLVPVD